MKPDKPENANFRFTSPPGSTDIPDLDVVMSTDPQGNTYISTLWRPSYEEQVALLSGLPLIVTVMGRSLPPLGVAVSRSDNKIEFAE